MRSCCSTTGKAVLGSQNFSTWTTLPAGAGIRATGKMAGMCLPSTAGGGQSRMKQAQEVALCAWLEAGICRSTVEI